MTKILILGGSGYLGNVFIDNFNKKSKINNPTERAKLLSTNQIDKFFNKIVIMR